MDLSIAKKHIEMLYLDRCDIYEYSVVVSPEDHTTSMKEVLAHKDLPCKISWSSKYTTSDSAKEIMYQRIRLILSPDIEVKAGSRILVTRGGVTTAYKNSGAPSRYFNHQEIALELEDDEP